MSRRTITVVLVTALAISGVVVAVLPGGEATDDGGIADEGPTQGAEISFTRQPSDGTTVVVDEVNLPKGGFVAIHDTTAEPPDPDLVGSVIGVSRHLDAGVHRNVTITLADPVDVSETDGSTRVIAMPHRDTNGNNVFDFVISNGTDDDPYSREGTQLTDPATLDLSSEPLPPEASVTFENQTTRGNTVRIDAATLSAGGFLAILDEEGTVVGVSEYIEAETRRNVRIDLVERPDEPTNFTVRAHLDTDGDRVFGFDISDGAVDRPYSREGTGATDAARIRPGSGDGTSTETDFGTASPSPTGSPTPTDFGTESPTATGSPTPTGSPTGSPSLLALVLAYPVGVVTLTRG